MATRQERIWFFDVTDPTNHPKGFTIYKVTAKVFPINSPESLTEVIVWKRYNDFKNLYKSMSNLHRALHRRDEMPGFAKPKLFGRFDEAVIEERRQSALDLLNFVGQQCHLYKSQLFQKFLEGGKIVQGVSGKVLKPCKADLLDSYDSSPPVPEVSPNVLEDSLLNPVRPPEVKGEEGAEDLQKSTSLADGTQGDNGEAELEGVWNFPQVPDNISLNSDDDTDATTDVDSALGTPLPDTDISFFDPLANDSSEDNPQTLRTSKSWLMEAMNTCVEMEDSGEGIPVPGQMEAPEEDDGLQMKGSLSRSEEELSDSTADTLAKSLSSQKSNSTLDVSEFDPLTQSGSSTGSGSRVMYGKGDLDISQLTAGFQSGSSTSIESSSSTASTPKKQKERSAKKHGVSPLRQRSGTKDSVSTMDLGGKEDYIYTAANQICMAQDYEANGNYEMAFASYKYGVGILLKGVQGDKNKSRRDAVRRKTAQYLMKAEDLYNRHLSKETTDEYRWAMDSKLTPTIEMDPSLALIRGSSTELKNFKVLGTIDKVVLVLDRCSDETFIIKRVYKSASGGRSIRNILPTSCPYMVQLHKFYETSTAIYLLLQYASGGKLWDYIGAYLQHAQTQNRETAGQGMPPLSKNVYMGLKVHECDNTVAGSQTETLKPNSIRKSKDNPSPSPDDFSALTDKAVSDQHEPQSGSNFTVDSQVHFSKTSDDVEIGASRQTQPDGPSSVVVDRDDSVTVNRKLSENESDLTEENDSLSEVGSCHISYNRYTSFSSEENQDVDPDLDQTHTGLERQSSSQSGQFQDVLQKNKTALENFSINSFDSGDGFMRVDSNVSDQIEIIHEVNEAVCDRDDVFKASEQESANQTAVVLSHDDHDDKEETVQTDDYLIKSAKELLRSVERTLSQVDNDPVPDQTTHKETADCDSQSSTVPNSPPCSARQDSNELHSSVEPSIYDIHHTGDTSDSQSESRSLYEVHAEQETAAAPDSQDGHLPSQDTDTPTTVFTCKDKTSSLKMDVSPSEPNSRLSESCDTSRTSTMSDSNAPPVPRKLSLNRMNSRELSRSASCEYDFKSPSKSRQRTISNMFEQLDLSSANSEVVKIPESFIKRWSAEIIVALSQLHAQGIICRELKPDNVLLGDQGHATLTYFCQINSAEYSLDFEAAEYLYMAPEVRSIGGFTEVCDWWSLGALLYELLVGRSLLSCHPGGITSHTQLFIPEHVSPEARALLQELLRFSPRERLGSGINGVEEIKAHPFFSSVDWNSMEM